jgi:hypothetical protein
MLGPLHGAGGQVSLQNNLYKLDETIKEATELTINLHKDIDPRELPRDIVIKHNAIGQCLRSILEMLENDIERNKNAPA